MASNNILVDIFNTLHRLEGRLEGQDFRLDNIESSIRSGSISTPPDEVDYPFSSSGSGRNSRSYRDKPLPAQPASTLAETSPAELYVASIQEMRPRFEFLDDSQSAIQETRDEPVWAEAGPSTKSQQHQLPLRERHNDDEDTYTHSVYSTDLLSSARLSMPIAATQSRQNKIDIKTTASGLGKENFVTVIGEAEPTSPTASARTFSVRSLRTLSTRYRSRRTSIDSKGSKSTHESYEIARMTYYACNNFVESLQTSKSLHSREKRFQQEERLRLMALATSKDAMHNSVDAKSSRNMTWAMALRRFLGGIFNGAVKVRGQRIYVVA